MPNSDTTYSPDLHGAIEHYLNTPGDLATARVEYWDELQKETLLKWPTAAMNQRLMKLLPGHLYFFVGRPGHGKTSVLIALTRSFGEQLKKMPPRPDGRQPIVVYATWETTVNDYEVALYSSSDLTITDFLEGKARREALVEQQVARVSDPVWAFGYRIGRGSTQHRMTFDVLEHALVHHDEYFGPNFFIAAVVLDYLQKMPFSGRFRDRTAEVTEATFRAEELVQQLMCPGFVGAQGARATDDEKPPIPQIHHSQHASAIEQTASFFAGIWRPVKTQAAGSDFQISKETSVKVTDELMVWGIRKQRGKPANYGDMMLFHLAPELCRLADLELAEPDPFDGYMSNELPD